MKYNRILIKLSGESLANPKKFGINFDYVLEVCEVIKRINDKGIGVGIVVGGGNWWRGRSNKHMDRITADYIGMLGTNMNALAVGDAFIQLGSTVRVMSAIQMREISEHFIRNRAIRHLEKGRILVFGCGTGNPYFSTDSAAALRAAEINADVIIKLTNVDGVYDKDPKKHDNAKLYSEVSYDVVLEKNLKVMDGAAIALCRDNGTPIIVTNIDDLNNLIKIADGKKIGTLVSN